MGVPKQKWTAEEELALKNGIAKHGSGKWRTILRDPEFSRILSLRSNVDLKDKWRNLSVTTNGWGSRERGRVSVKRSRHDNDDNPMAITTVSEYDNEDIDVQPLAVSTDAVRTSTPRKSESRLDGLIREAIITLKEPTGSSKIDIGIYIEDQYEAPPNFKQLLHDKLKDMTRSGKLIKVKRKYRIAPTSPISEGKSPKMFLSAERHKDLKALTKHQVDAELARIRNMNAVEAEAAAAKAVKEAEMTIAEAEEATAEAEIAENEYEEAQAFADAANSTLKNRITDKQWPVTDRVQPYRM